MKKIYIAIAAVLFTTASVATVLAVRSHNRMDDFFRANVDALTGMEAYPVKVCFHEVKFGADDADWLYREFCNDKTSESTKYTCVGEKWGYVGTEDFCIK